MLRGIAILLVAIWPSAGQETSVVITPRVHENARPSASLPQANIRIDSNLVLVPVTVADKLNRFVSGLEQEDFRIFEDETEQKIVSFGSEDAPLSMGIVFDTSGSMGNKLSMSRVAVAELFKIVNPEDEGFLVEFNSRPELIVPFTHRPGEIEARLLSTRSKGSTALLDGVALALRTMRGAHNPRKALVLITDGGDNHSRYTEAEVREKVQEADVQIYAIGIYGGGSSPEEYYGPNLLRNLSKLTGGHHFAAELSQLPDVAAKIGVELRNQYLIGYSPANHARDGRFRRIQVKLKPPPGLPPLRAWWRQGYYAPTQ